MLRQALFLLMLVIGSTVQASSPLPVTLNDLACGADHFLIGRVVGVDMVDGSGALIENERARTGPGLPNEIRLEIEVLEVISSTKTSVPTKLKVPLDSFMHFSLGQIRRAHLEPSEPTLVFLAGDGFSPVVAGRFLWTKDDQEQAVGIRKECRTSS